jgi:hypothetical protein
MASAIGIGLALLTALFARATGLDRDRAFYPTVLIVSASYYVLFAVMGGSTRAVLVESLGLAGFAALAVVGFRRNLWLVVAALAGHGAFDFVHGRLVANPGVPAWWPAFCLAYDIALAGSLAWLVSRSHLTSRQALPHASVSEVEKRH